MPAWINDLIDQVFTFSQTLLTIPTLTQLGVLLGVFLLAALLRGLFRRLLGRFHNWLSGQSLIQEYLPWLPKWVHWPAPAAFPLLAWLLAGLARNVLDSAGLAAEILGWAVPLLGLLVLYILLLSLLTGRLAPERADFWQRRVLRPLFFIILFLQAVGLLDDLLSAGPTVGETPLRLGSILAGLFVLYIFAMLARSSRSLLGETVLPKAGINPSLTQVLVTFIGYIIIGSGVALALSTSGIPLTALTVIIGGLSVDIGFGMQELISNFISGFILLFEGSIGPTDIVAVDDTIGVVEFVGIRAMRIKNFDNVELIVPNTRFLTEVVTNYSRGSGDSRLRVHIPVGVSYEASPRLVREALLAAASHAGVLEDPPPQVHFIDFGASSLDFELMVWTENVSGVPDLRSDLRFQIWDSLTERGIEIPFPQHDVHIRSMAGLPLTGGADSRSLSAENSPNEDGA